MIELAKLIHSQQENDEDIVITDRRIVLDRTMRLYGEMTFKNCDFEIAPRNDSRFILEAESSVTFEDCRFAGALAKPTGGSGVQRAIISGAEDSALTFIKCHMENADSFIHSDGAVNLHGCEISYSGNAASGDEAYKPVSGTPRYTPYAAIGAALSRSFAVKNPTGSLLFEFIRADGEEVELTDCTIDCEESDGFSVILPVEHGTLRSCTLRGVLQLEADVLENCTFENCVTVNLQTEDGNNEATDCRFTNCREIIAESADLTDCEFSGMRDNIALENSTAARCIFRDMTPHTDGILDLDSTELTDCTFENITLKKDFYLFDADNDSSLDGCTFKNCRTTRDDLQLVSTGGYRGKLRKKWVEDDICFGCIGLDKVIHLEVWEV